MYAESLRHETTSTFALALSGIARQVGLNTSELASVLGVTPFECARILAGRREVPADSELVERFALLGDVHRGLARLFDHDIKRMQQWLHTAHSEDTTPALNAMATLEGLRSVLNRIGELLSARENARKVVCI